jgi:hypothetical protein
MVTRGEAALIQIKGCPWIDFLSVFGKSATMRRHFYFVIFA